jgi:cardiolipin synthase
VTVDGRWCVIGTCNWDIRSMTLHEEVSCVFYEEDLARRQAEVFRQDLESCREFTLDDWHALSRGERLRNSFLRLFSRLL